MDLGEIEARRPAIIKYLHKMDNSHRRKNLDADIVNKTIHLIYVNHVDTAMGLIMITSVNRRIHSRETNLP